MVNRIGQSAYEFILAGVWQRETCIHHDVSQMDHRKASLPQDLTASSEAAFVGNELALEIGIQRRSYLSAKECAKNLESHEAQKPTLKLECEKVKSNEWSSPTRQVCYVCIQVLKAKYHLPPGMKRDCNANLHKVDWN